MLEEHRESNLPQEELEELVVLVVEKLNVLGQVWLALGWTPEVVEDEGVQVVDRLQGGVPHFSWHGATQILLAGQTRHDHILNYGYQQAQVKPQERQL